MKPGYYTNKRGDHVMSWPTFKAADHWSVWLTLNRRSKEHTP